MLSYSWLVLTLLTSSDGVYAETKRRGYGFVGYGIDLWQPVCAAACRSSVARAPLFCEDDSQPGQLAVNATKHPSAQCYATNTPFLQTIAWCISTHCGDIEKSKLEHYWQYEVPGELIGQPSPKWTYQQTLDAISEPPRTILSAKQPLLNASLVNEDRYSSEYNAMSTWVWVEVKHETYGLLLLFSGSVVPIVLSLIRFVPGPAVLTSRFTALLIDAPAYSAKRWQVVFGTGLVPSRGQALFIAYFWLLNIWLCVAGYRAGEKTTWWDSIYEELGRYIANRTGVLSIANLALMVLWAGRNNALLWLTNWSPSTFLLLHRWLAFISILQACIHSAIFLYGVVASARDIWAQIFIPYWFWGSVATVAMCLVVPLSIQQVRRKFYEIFLASHIVLALATCIGYYYHIYYLYEHQLGYENWVFIALAIWAIDRFCRAVRILRYGVRIATVTVIDEDYIKLDIPGVHASGEAYLYFPTLTWRIWENHPFSIANTLRYPQSTTIADVPLLRTNSNEPMATQDASSSASERSSLLSVKSGRAGLTVLIRTHAGVTGILRRRERATVLIEGSYGQSLLESDEPHRACQNVICIAGGVGVTAVAPMLATSRGRRKLYWGVRRAQLVWAMRDVWAELELSDLDMDVRVGERLDLPDVIAREIATADDAKQSIAIVVSGPPSMADEVRAEVAKRAWRTRHAAVTFIEKSYSW